MQQGNGVGVGVGCNGQGHGGEVGGGVVQLVPLQQ